MKTEAEDLLKDLLKVINIENRHKLFNYRNSCKFLFYLSSIDPRGSICANTTYQRTLRCSIFIYFKES